MPDLDLAPFAENARPLAAYTDAEGYEALMQSPRRHAQKLCPNAAKLAESVAALHPGETWGEQLLSGRWVTYQAGTEGKFGAEQRLCGSSLTSAYCRPGKYALGAKDTYSESRADATARAEDRGTPCVRLDLDLDYAFGVESFELLAEAVEACHAAGDRLGLPCLVFETGGRGIQAVYRLPQKLSGPDARLVTEAVRFLLPHPGLDKDGSRSIMRLPLMRHGATGNLGLFLSREAVRLPLAEQLSSAVLCLTPTGGDAALLLAAAAEVLGDPQGARGSDALVRRPEEPMASQKRARGGKHARWEALRAEPLFAGETWSYLADRGGVYAHVWAYGKAGARARLREKVLAMPEDGKAAERLAKVERLVDAYDLRSRAGHEEPTAELHEDDERAAADYADALRAEGGRKDTVESHYLVCRALLHARRTWGAAIDGADAYRMFCRLCGERALARSRVFAILGAMRGEEYVCSPISAPVEFGEDLFCASGYLVTPEAFANTGHSRTSSEAIGQSIEAGHLFQPRKRSSPSASPCRSVQPASSTSRQSARSPDSGSEATARTYAVSACT